MNSVLIKEAVRQGSTRNSCRIHEYHVARPVLDALRLVGHRTDKSCVQFEAASGAASGLRFLLPVPSLPALNGYHGAKSTRSSKSCHRSPRQ